MTQGSMKESFLEKLKARKAANGATVTAPQQAPQAPQVNPPEQHVAAPPPAAPTPATPEAARGRGRPKGSTTKAAAAPSEEAAGGWTLYIDCAPTRLPAGSLPPQSADDLVDLPPELADADMTRAAHLMWIQQRLASDPPLSGVVLFMDSKAGQALFAFMQEASAVVDGRVFPAD